MCLRRLRCHLEVLLEHMENIQILPVGQSLASAAFLSAYNKLEVGVWGCGGVYSPAKASCNLHNNKTHIPKPQNFSSCQHLLQKLN